MSGGFQRTDSFDQDDDRLDQDFGVDSDDEEVEDSAFGEEWKEFRRAFPAINAGEERGFDESEVADATWAMRQPKNPFAEEDDDEIVNEDDPFAPRASDPFSQDDDTFDKNADDDFGGFVGAGDGGAKSARDTEDPFSQFEQEASKEVSWSSFASDFGEFEKLKVTNVESPTVEVLTKTNESEFKIAGEQDDDQAEPEVSHS
jgi:hypothetical protein